MEGMQEVTVNHDERQRQPWAAPKAEDLGTTAEARNQAASSLDGRLRGHKQS